MSAPHPVADLLHKHGRGRELGAYVVAAAFAPGRSQVAFALGDGTLHITDAAAGDDWRTVAAHAGAVLALAADGTGSGWLTGGDDGRFCRVGTEVAEIARFGNRWVEHVAGRGEQAGGLLVCAVGRELVLFDGHGRRGRSLAHPSTVTAIAFDRRGKRLAAAHYRGASVWFTAAREGEARRLEWGGSHIAVAISPDGATVVTAMQENALHGWRLADGQHMSMTGYPGKTTALGFSHSGKWLASAGAESLVLWPFSGAGPMGRPPLEIDGPGGCLCTMVACHPRHEVVAAGFADGTVLLADIPAAATVTVCGPGNGPVSALAWSDDGSHLAFGTESGFAAVLRLAPP
jgi:WD40 repeat protein